MFSGERDITGSSLALRARRGGGRDVRANEAFVKVVLIVPLKSCSDPQGLFLGIIGPIFLRFRHSFLAAHAPSGESGQEGAKNGVEPEEERTGKRKATFFPSVFLITLIASRVSKSCLYE